MAEVAHFRSDSFPSFSEKFIFQYYFGILGSLFSSVIFSFQKHRSRFCSKFAEGKLLVVSINEMHCQEV